MALTMPPGTGAGIVHGICAAIFSGSWSWIVKVDAVKAGCHPSVLTAHLATVMFASCWLVLSLLSDVNQDHPKSYMKWPVTQIPPVSRAI